MEHRPELHQRRILQVPEGPLHMVLTSVARNDLLIRPTRVVREQDAFAQDPLAQPLEGLAIHPVGQAQATLVFLHRRTEDGVEVLAVRQLAQVLLQRGPGIRLTPIALLVAGGQLALQLDQAAEPLAEVLPDAAHLAGQQAALRVMTTVQVRP